MSEKIDWSKAPESAMVLLKHRRDNSYAWAASHSEDARAWHEWNIQLSFNLMACMWRVVSMRPTTPSWSGEGLPPVGVVCEVYHDGEWYETTIIGLDPDDGSRVFKTHPDYDAPYDGFVSSSSFRPIRTPEQIAADERDAAVTRMLCHDALGGSRRDMAEALYDAGYRKP